MDLFNTTLQSLYYFKGGDFVQWHQEVYCFEEQWDSWTERFLITFLMNFLLEQGQNFLEFQNTSVQNWSY